MVTHIWDANGTHIDVSDHMWVALWATLASRKLLFGDFWSFCTSHSDAKWNSKLGESDLNCASTQIHIWDVNGTHIDGSDNSC